MTIHRKYFWLKIKIPKMDALYWPQEDFDNMPNIFVTIYLSKSPNYNTLMLFSNGIFMLFLFTLFFNSFSYSKLLRGKKLKVEVKKMHGQNTATTTHAWNLEVRMILKSRSLHLYFDLTPQEIRLLIEAIQTQANSLYQSFGDMINYVTLILSTLLMNSIFILYDKSGYWK